MKLLDGLHAYEMVLMLLGVLLFLVLIVAFVVLLIRGKPFGKLFVFFAIPVLMIGFPGIKTVEIGKDVVKIEKETRDLEQNPTDRALRESLSKRVTSMSARSFADPHAAATIARAQIALGGDIHGAEKNLHNALRASPQLPAALELKKQLELDRNLDTLSSRVEQNPGDGAAKARLASTVNEVKRLAIASPETLTNLARAQKVLGNDIQAQENVDKALAINPNLAPAIKLKSKIGGKMVPPG